MLYMPTWTFDEIKMVAGNNMTSVKEKYDEFGGIPRYIFGINHQTSTQE